MESRPKYPVGNPELRGNTRAGRMDARGIIKIKVHESLVFYIIFPTFVIEKSGACASNHE
jgi:hypothetical protein